MKKIIQIFISIFLVANSYGQSPFMPYMVNTAGGSGNVGNTHYDFTIGEPVTTFGSGGCDSLYAGFQHMAVDTLRFKKMLISINGSTILCTNTVVTLTAPAGTGYSYLWSPGGATTQVLPVTTTGSYSATVTNSCNNVLSTNVVSVSAYPVPIPTICVVTVDSLGNNNEIYWDKAMHPEADSFFVYRETTGGVYTLIGRVSKNGPNSYIDTNRVAVPGCYTCTTGNPNLTYYKYKLKTRDTCGKMSNFSLYHSSIHVQDQQNSNFNWNLYDIGGTLLSSATYIMWRQSALTTAPSTVVGVSTNGNFTDPQYSVLAQNGGVKWYVATSGLPPCSGNIPAMANRPGAASVPRTKSNNTNERQFPSGISILSFEPSSISVFPNPANTRLTITANSNIKELSVRVMDVSGRVFIEGSLSDSQIELNVKDLPAGLYFVNVYQQNTFISSKKLILEH